MRLVGTAGCIRRILGDDDRDIAETVICAIQQLIPRTAFELGRVGVCATGPLPRRFPSASPPCRLR